MEATIDQEAQAIVSEAVTVAERLTAITIKTPSEYEGAGGEVRAIAGLKKKLEAARVKITGPLNAALKAANDLFRGPADKLTQAEQALKRAMQTYSTEQERIRAEAQRKLDDEAAAEREKLRKAQEAIEARAREEQERLTAKADAERMAGNEAAARKLETQAEAKAEKAAVKLDAYAGAIEAAVAPVVVAPTPTVTGVSFRESWKFEVVDAALIPRAYLIVNESAIRAAVTTQKAAAVIPGVRIWAEKTPVVRS